MSELVYLPAMDTRDTIDARGLLCPLPVLKLRKRLKNIAIGEIIELWADDPAAIIDVPHFCNEAGQDLVSTENCDGYDVYRVRKSI